MVWDHRTRALEEKVAAGGWRLGNGQGWRAFVMQEHLPYFFLRMEGGGL